MVRAPRPSPLMSRSFARFCKEKGLNVNGVNVSALQHQLKEAADLQAFEDRQQERAKALEALLDKFNR